MYRYVLYYFTFKMSYFTLGGLPVWCISVFVNDRWRPGRGPGGPKPGGAVTNRFNHGRQSTAGGGLGPLRSLKI